MRRKVHTDSVTPGNLIWNNFTNRLTSVGSSWYGPPVNYSPARPLARHMLYPIRRLFSMRHMFQRGSLLTLLLLVMAGSALANTCNNFATYTCAQATPNTARLGGGSASGQSIGFVLNGTNQFSVFSTNGNPADDVILVGASVSALSGTLNGTSFTSLSSFPEGGALGAISSSLAGRDSVPAPATASRSATWT